MVELSKSMKTISKNSDRYKFNRLENLANEKYIYFWIAAKRYLYLIFGREGPIIYVSFLDQVVSLEIQNSSVPVNFSHLVLATENSLVISKLTAHNDGE